MSGLPKGWVEATLGELGSWQGGGTPDKSNSSYWNSGTIPWVSPKDMKRFHISDAEDQITDAALAKSSTNLIAENSVLIVTRSGILKHTLPVALTGRDVAINQDIKALTPYRELDPIFIAQQVKYLGPFVLKNCTKAGTTVDSVDFDSLKSVSANIPPLAEQKRIVAKLDALNAKSARARTELARIKTLVSRYKQAVLSQAFSGNLTPQHKDVAAMESDPGAAARIDGRTPDLPSLPPTWNWVALCSMAEISGGLTKNSNRGSLPLQLPYLRVANVYANELRLDDVSIIGCTENEVARTLLRDGDLLLVEGNGSLDQIGRVAVWSGELDRCVHQNHLIKVRPGKGLEPKFALYWLLSPLGRRAIEAVAASSAGLHTLSLSKVGGLPLPLCSTEEQHEIVRRIEAAFARIDRLAGQAKRALELVGKLDEAILAKAFRGELVPQDENDEPADRLLARIRAERQAAPKAKRGRRPKA